jgi:hypothetical protein
VTLTPDLLTKILEITCNTEAIPSCWKTGLIVKLKKKEDMMDCKNWRENMLLSATRKVLG